MTFILIVSFSKLEESYCMSHTHSHVFLHLTVSVCVLTHRGELFVIAG